MRASKKVKKKQKTKSKRNNLSGFRGFSKVVAVIYLLLSVYFEIEIIRLNILPAKYLLPMLLILTPVTLIIFCILFFNGVTKWKKNLALAISLILMLTSLMGTGYATGTINFLNKISSIGDKVTYETYLVIVPIEAEAETIEDLNETTVGIYSIPNENYSKARNDLKEIIAYETSVSDDLDSLATGLLEGKYESILLSETNYETIEESNDGYKEKTRILYSYDIEDIQRDTARRIDVTEESFNIFVSGIDVFGDINKVSRSDVNMIITVNPKTNKILLTSIPRDCSVTLPTYGEKDKLTHAGLYGVDESIGAVEELLGIEINYYIKVNFSAVENLVDAIDGIDVDSDYAFTARKGGYYYNKGMNHLNGPEALSFARERYAFREGDFQRVINQQKVIEAVLKKISKSTTMLMNYNSILGAVDGNMDTNMAPEDIKALVKMQLNKMPSWEFEKSSLDEGSDALMPGYTYGNQKLYVFVPNKDKIIEVEDKINLVMSEE